MLPASHDIFLHGLEALGLALDAARVERLIGYHDLLMARNQELNLTGHKDEAESVVKNLLNALGPWRQIHPTKSSCDVGSGPGLPGIPLAIALGMGNITLIESKQKKARFLEEATKEFAPEVKVWRGDVKAHKERYQQVVTCAFGTLADIMDSARRCVGNGGRVLAYKGKRERIEAEIAACKPAERRWELIPFTVPGLEADAERYLCVWKAS